LQPGKSAGFGLGISHLGYGHGAQFWLTSFRLRSVGYDGVLSIEHEDPLMDAEEAIGRAVDLLRNAVFFGPPSGVPGARRRIEKSVGVEA
jgi:hypothetical protein